MAKRTATDMWNDTRIIFEDMASMSAPGYTPPEISRVLTQAQEKTLLELKAAGYEKDENTRRVFSSLVQFSIISGANISISGIFPNGYIVSLATLEAANDYWFAVGEFASATNSTLGNLTGVSIRALEWDEILQNIDNPFKNPCDYRFWKTTYNSNTLIITDGSVLTSLAVTYLSKPAPIIVPETAILGYSYFPTGDTSTIFPITEGWVVVPNGTIPGAKRVVADIGQDCSLDDSIHLTICEQAAKMIYASIKDVQGYKIAENEEKS